MKKFIASLFIFSFAFAGTVYAQGMMGNRQQNAGVDSQITTGANLDSALQEIYKNQNVAGSSELDCAKVTDAQYEKLGDVYMEAVHPGQAHTYMEQMMGGEGSATLRQAHINMGRAYLGCWSNYNATPLAMPMMGGYGKMFNSSANAGFGMGGWNMMGGYGWAGSIGMVLIWIALILVIVGLVKYISKKQ